MELQPPDPHQDFQGYLDYIKYKSNKKLRKTKTIDMKSLTIRDFEIYTTLGIFYNIVLIFLRNRNIWES